MGILIRERGLEILCVVGVLLHGKGLGFSHRCDEVLADLQKKTTTFQHALVVLKRKVPAETYDMEMPVLLEHFLDGHLDPELLEVLAEQREEWELEGLSMFHQVTQRHEVRNAGEARKRQNERAAKAATATLEMLSADIKEDAEDVKRYHDMLAKVRREHDRQVCRYRRERYETGQEKVAAFMAQRCNVVDIGPSPKHCSKAVAEARRLFDAGDNARSLVLIYVDLNTSHSPATLALISEAAKLLHLSPDYGLCVRWMMRHANTSPDHVQKLNRKVEDLLQAQSIFMSESPATLLFDPSDMRKADQRQLAARFSIAVSQDFCDGSVWVSTPAWRGNLGQATLVKWPDMMQPAVAKGQGGIGEVKLSPKARVSQLGTPAFKQFLENLPSRPSGRGTSRLSRPTRSASSCTWSRASLGNSATPSWTMSSPLRTRRGPSSRTWACARTTPRTCPRIRWTLASILPMGTSWPRLCLWGGSSLAGSSTSGGRPTRRQGHLRGWRTSQAYLWGYLPCACALGRVTSPW